MANVINKFIGEFAFLSNFFPSTIFLDKKRYATVEHAYQAFKTLNESEHEVVRNSRTPSEAKKLGSCLLS